MTTAISESAQETLRHLQAEAASRLGLIQALGTIPMPWLLIYLLVVATVAILGVRDEMQDGEPLALAVAELFADALLIVAALGYWLEPVRNLMGSAAPFVYVAGLSGVGLSTVREIRKLKPDPELSSGANLTSVVIGVSLFIVLYSPLIYWGFTHAYGGLHNGA